MTIHRKIRTARRWLRTIGHPRTISSLLTLSSAGREGGSHEPDSSVPLDLRGFPVPVHARPGTSDYVTFKEIFLTHGGEYADFVQEVEGPVRYILDLGSNVGYSIAYFLRIWPDAKVSGVEPFDPNVRMIQKTFDEFIRRGQVAVHQAFVGSAEGRAAIVSGGAGGANEIQMDRSVDSLASEDVDDAAIVPVDAILAEDHPQGMIDILKCDVEGGEEEVFSHCASWIHRVRYLVAELHDGLDEVWLAETLAQNGARAEVLGTRKGYGSAKLAWCQLND